MKSPFHLYPCSIAPYICRPIAQSVFPPPRAPPNKIMRAGQIVANTWGPGWGLHTLEISRFPWTLTAAPAAPAPPPAPPNPIPPAI